MCKTAVDRLSVIAYVRGGYIAQCKNSNLGLATSLRNSKV